LRIETAIAHAFLQGRQGISRAGCEVKDEDAIFLSRPHLLISILRVKKC
jgi:hypothetical protein